MELYAPTGLFDFSGELFLSVEQKQELEQELDSYAIMQVFDKYIEETERFNTSTNSA